MGKLLWQPSARQVQDSNMYHYMQMVNKRYDQTFSDYPQLYQWSVDNIADFWDSLWDYLEIRSSARGSQVIDDPAKMPGARWFDGARLNFAENLLRFRDDHTALIFWGEDCRRASLTYAELYDQVSRMAGALKAAGVVAGDRVAGFMPNMPQTVVAMLAATSLGATWSSCSPDFGIKGVLDRFVQIKH